MTTLHLRKSISRSPLRLVFLLIPLALACFGLSPQGTVCREGCLTNGNTVLGDDALVNNTSGDSNTAIGFQALYNNTTGFENTAIGEDALDFNTTGISNTANGPFALTSNTTSNSNTALAQQGLRSFDIQFSTNGGKTYHLITTDLPAGARSYDWQLPASSGIPDVRVRVIARDKLFQDSSDGANVIFSIIP